MRQFLVAGMSTLAGNALGAALPFFVVLHFGPNDRSDAFFYAASATVFLTTLVALVVESVVVPFVADRRNFGPAEVQRWTRRVGGQAAVLATLVAGVGIGALRIWILPATDFSVLQQEEVVRLLCVLVLLAPLMAFNGVYAGALYAHKRFGLAAGTQALRSLAGLAAVLCSNPNGGLWLVAIALVAGEGLRSIILTRRLPAAARAAVPHILSNREAPRDRFWSVASPQIASMALIGLNPLVDRSVAAGLPITSVTLLELSEKLFFMPTLLLSSAIGTVCASVWADAAASSAMALRRDYWRIQKLCAVAGTAIASLSVLAVLIGGTRFASALGLASPSDFRWTLGFYAVGIPFALLTSNSVRLLVSLKKTSLLPLFAGGALVLNLVADLVATHLLGISGIAVASTLVRIVATAGYLVVTTRVLACRTQIKEEAPCLAA